MRTRLLEKMDTALTQSIERYLVMDINELCEAIAAEWPRQLAILILEFLLSTSCKNCGMTPDFVRFKRKESDDTYIAPLCQCEHKERLSEEILWEEGAS